MMHEIAARMFNTPLLLDAAKASVIARHLGPRILGGDVTVNLGVVGNPIDIAVDMDGVRIVKPAHTVDGVAIIPVEGSLVAKGKWVEKSSGMTSYEGIQAQMRLADADPAVRAIVFEVDSFGGEVSGAFACAKAIAELSARKPTLAILSDHACSAGYLLASGCRGIVVPETGYVGSIGVIAMHTDFSAAMKQAGIAVTILASGAHKSEFNPYEPLPEDVAARFRADLDGLRDLFAETVGRHRGDRLTKDAALATEAATYRGEAAVAAGLADAVADPAEAFEAFVAEMSRTNG